MLRLKEIASKDFFEISLLSYISGVISWSQFCDRLHALNSMVDPHDPIGNRIKRGLHFYRDSDGETDDKWLGSRLEDETIITGGSCRFEDKDGVIYLYPNSITGLSDWEFHQYDDDHFPSVPHGHWQGQGQPKLDPYLGWVYRNSKQIDRADRNKIIALWNSDEFRKFAHKAIRYHLEHHPYIRFRVKNPLRLPRKRRR